MATSEQQEQDSLNAKVQGMSLNESGQDASRDGEDSNNEQTPTVTPTTLPANVQARIQAFQISRRNRSNSAASAYPTHNNNTNIDNDNPNTPFLPYQPQQSSHTNLVRSSSTYESSMGRGPHSNNSMSSPNMAALSGEGRPNSSNSGNNEGSTPFSGPLSFTPPTSQAAAPKKPPLSMRRGTPKLNTEDLNQPAPPPQQQQQQQQAQTQTQEAPVSAPAITSSNLNPTLPGGRIPQSNNNTSGRKNRPQLPKGSLPETGTGNTILSNYKKYIDIKTGSLNFAGKASLHSKGIDFSSGSSFRVSLDEFESLGELGRGNYGTVTKVYHKKYDVVMAMKEIRLELDEAKFTQIIMELEVLHKCASPYIVDFYGAFFAEGAVYVCMEYMDGGSLDKIYQSGVDEACLASITESVVRGLKQLKDEHNIIHRDVKPTNILVSTTGKVKLCDFGVSGNLVASMAKTNIGCQSYMAPERIKSQTPADAMTYTVHSDIWSLGLSILETAKGCYPYPPETYGNIFSQLSAIVDGDPPSLPEDKFSPEARDFVDQCLNKVPKLRPSYSKLLAHPWLQKYRNQKIDMGDFVQNALNKKESNNGNNIGDSSAVGNGDAVGESNSNDSSSSSARPALHNGRRDG